MSTKPTTRTDNLDPEFVRMVEEGRRDIREGRVIDHEKVRAWLLSWGTDNELPPPE